jgi:8-oxo-dGTP diphosphatase
MELKNKTYLCVQITQRIIFMNPSVEFEAYQNPALTVDIVVFGYCDKRLSVLLLKRMEAPYAGKWTFPGGFIAESERLSDTCTRILKSKIGIETIYLEQLYTFDEPRRDPRGRVISIAYYGLINPIKYKHSLTTLGKSSPLKWVEVNKVPALGFDHNAIFQVALSRLRAKILYQPIGFELLDGKFTLSELQDLYEIILEKKLDRRNFRKKMLSESYIIPTGEKLEGNPNRNPDVYIFNKDMDSCNFKISIAN